MGKLFQDTGKDMDIQPKISLRHADKCLLNHELSIDCVTFFKIREQSGASGNGG
jgi:hypothetical protein